jgi:GNAT superfamily N-acetyltransferase
MPAATAPVPAKKRRREIRLLESNAISLTSAFYSLLFQVQTILFKGKQGNIHSLSIVSKQTIHNDLSSIDCDPFLSEWQIMKRTSGKEATFRKATEADTGLLQEMIKDYYVFDKQKIDEATIQSSLAIALKENPHVIIWIIEVDRKVAGYLAIVIGFTIEVGGKDGFLDELFLKSRYRGLGLGRQAVNFAIEICPSLGIRRLSLEVEQHNKRARQLYEDVGFFTHDRILMSHWID